MKTRIQINRGLLWGVLVASVLPCVPSLGGHFVAYSLVEAQRLCEEGGHLPPELHDLGGITLPLGIVYDDRRRDVIFVGEVIAGRAAASLDDLAVAIRACLKLNAAPLVSIDRTSDTDTTGQQTVRFEGGIEDTEFGSVLLEADVILKKMGLGKLPTNVWGIRSYFDLKVEEWTATQKENAICSRFWFKPSKQQSYVAVHEAVAIVNRLVMDIETEVTSVPVSDGVASESSHLEDEIGRHFSRAMAASFDDIAVAHPALARLDTLFRLSGLAQALGKWRDEHNWDSHTVDYWITQYPVEERHTDRTYPLVESKSDQSEGKVMTVDGGVELQALLRDLHDRSITAFRDVVILSRPDVRRLVWEVPLGPTWHFEMETDHTDDVSDTISHLPGARQMGMTLRTQFGSHGGSAYQLGRWSPIQPTSSAISKPSFSFTDALPRTQYCPNVGGVMLQGTARVEGARSAQVDLNSGNFSLVVDGQNARLDPRTFRRFVTALWSVYYSNQDPGISIDPIAPGIDKHMVRYIGKVINTDLGRVMREADYLMKTWSVGTARPDIGGFQSPDDVSGRRGYAYLGASRFWFVPQDMRFRRAEELLLFDSGRMTVRTEYLFDNGTGMTADPANEQFAQFLTDRYGDLAAKYSVLQELFDYAKMVSLAKYLKESGVPLYWFLMANKDLVLTEDSPGTVEALARGSDYFKNLRIEGGVDLAIQGQYVYDSQALHAFREAARRYATADVGTAAPSYRVTAAPAVGRSFSFDLDGKSYSVVPQHSLTSGKDHRGIRYQTDIALRARGFKLTREAWEALRHDITYRAFAQRWNRQVNALGESTRDGEAQRLYEQTWTTAEQEVASDLKRLEKLIESKHESEESFARAVETALDRSVDAWIMALAKKHAYYQTDLEVVRFFNPMRRKRGEFGQGWELLVPYRVKSVGMNKRDFRGVPVPEKMAIENLVTGEQEVLHFDTDRYAAAGYVPKAVETSQVVGLFLMTDASYRLVDKLGNEFGFDPGGYPTEMSFSPHHRVNVEYVDALENAFKEAPYAVQPANGERVPVLNAMVPKVLVITDRLNDAKEELVFAEEITAYIPKSGAASRFEVLHLMTDCSFRLRDKRGNEIDFGSDGGLTTFTSPANRRVIRAISASPYRVDFRYTLGTSGEVLVADAQLFEEGVVKPLYAVHYDYDLDSRLCSTRRSEGRLAHQGGTHARMTIVARR